MKYIASIQKGVDYIEDNLDQAITLEAVAQQAHLSLWHFQRTFKALTGETLKTYIRSRRLSNSLKKLLDPNARIIDIALDSGFESQEAFSRAFKKAFAMTPGDFRAIGENHIFMDKVQFNAEYLQHINSSISMTPEIFNFPERHFVGLKTSYYGVESEKNNLADKLPPLWGEFMSRLGEIKSSVPGICYGLIQKTDSPSGELNYFAVIEVSQIKDIPQGMEVITLPPTKYAKFTHKGAVKKLDLTVNYIFSSWLANSDFIYSNGVDIESYGKEYHPTSEQSIIYYYLPIMS